MTMIIDGTNGLTFNNATTQNSGGKVLQVVNVTFSTVVTSTTNTWADTGLSATITPLFSTSKILVECHAQDVTKGTSNTQVAFRLLRGATAITTMGTSAAYSGNTLQINAGSVSTSYLDSPATTSATTYKLQIANDGNTGTVYLNDGYNLGNPASVITLMEISA